jgi:hypothetical protein
MRDYVAMQMLDVMFSLWAKNEKYGDRAKRKAQSDHDERRGRKAEYKAQNHQL